ncbi:MAG: FHA domain-containing protein [Stagnimonas sp.]|nr:FHA domain-containing protein [Stagnimonas sp.]
MVKLVWKVPGQAPLAFPLRQERVSVGRDAGNDIRLPEPAVSSRHATIIRKAGRVVLHDLKSSNGTWVNGARIDNQELVHGDMVAFGRVVMAFIDEDLEAPAPPPKPAAHADAPPRRVISAPPPSPAPSPAASPAPVPAPPSAPPPLPPLAWPAPASPARASSSSSSVDLEATLPRLVAMAPAAAPAAADQPGSLALDATLPRLLDPAAGDTLPRPPPPVATGPDLKELDRLLGSIRSFRDQETDVVRQRQAELLHEWRATLSYAEAMKARLADESRIRFFDVSERRQEIVLRIVRIPGEPNRLLSLTWGHPDQRDKAPDGIWMRATHNPDRRFYKSAEAVRELVATLASFLA